MKIGELKEKLKDFDDNVMCATCGKRKEKPMGASNV